MNQDSTYSSLAQSVSTLADRVSVIVDSYRLSHKDLTQSLVHPPVVVFLGHGETQKHLLAQEWLREALPVVPSDHFLLARYHAASDKHHADETQLIERPFQRLQEFIPTSSVELKTHALRSSPIGQKDALVLLVPDNFAEKKDLDHYRLLTEVIEMADVVVWVIDSKAPPFEESRFLAGLMQRKNLQENLALVVHRIDQFADTAELLTTYGQTCWYLAQSLNTPKMPQTFLTRSQQSHMASPSLLPHQLGDLGAYLQKAPMLRLASTLKELEDVCEQSLFLLEELLSFTRQMTRAWISYTFMSLLGSLIFGAIVGFLIRYSHSVTWIDDDQSAAILGLTIALIGLFISQKTIVHWILKFKRKDVLQTMLGPRTFENSKDKVLWSKVRQNFEQELTQNPPSKARSVYKKDKKALNKLLTQAQSLRAQLPA